MTIATLSRTAVTDSVRLSTEILCIPLPDSNGYILFTPDVKTVAVGNGAMVNVLADVESGAFENDYADARLIRLLEDRSLTTHANGPDDLFCRERTAHTVFSGLDKILPETIRAHGLTETKAFAACGGPSIAGGDQSLAVGAMQQLRKEELCLGSVLRS